MLWVVLTVEIGLLVVRFIVGRLRRPVSVGLHFNNLSLKDRLVIKKQVRSPRSFSDLDLCRVTID